jgi:8-oxo-dGTP pyrophosphatase MutT (NUDIX family)
MNRQIDPRKLSCTNCGKIGHINKVCRYPTNSYGCVIYKQSNSEHDYQVRFLMIQKKYTPEYLELIRGRYYDQTEINYNYLLLLIVDLPIIERKYILRYDFDYLWKHIWTWIGNEEQMNRAHTDYMECQRRFNLLKNGHQFRQYGLLSFQTLFENNPTNIIEPEWEFPKGKRRDYETDQQCAVRECCEETSLEAKDFTLYLHVKPFQEKFTGVNDIKYCNSFYLARMTNPQKKIYYDPNHLEQNREIRKIGWFTESDIYQLINPRLIHRSKMIHAISLLVKSLISD